MSIAYDVYVSFVLNESDINTQANPELQPSLNKVLFYDAIVGFYLKLTPLFRLVSSYRNSIAASAVCTFNLSAIAQVFKGPFKYQENSRSAWLPYPNPNPDFQVTKASTAPRLLFFSTFVGMKTKMDGCVLLVHHFL